ncbi:hypothetical protein V1951_21270 [Yersinia sp. 2544 StPb PI]|uniref:hypothetical protein n=1 Tax=Yersinia sp. 2544 StPb PI TaxID=3117409 RepID=UPI003B27C71C
MNKLIIVLPLILAGCAHSTQINRGDGRKTFMVECGAGTPWSICYGEANKLCPGGYIDISKSSGFNRKEMIVECK